MTKRCNIITRSLKSHYGYSLIELMTALILAGIMASSFLGIMTFLSKANQRSRTILLATAAANNWFERMKSYSLEELAQLPAHQSITEDSFILQTDIERYIPETTNRANNNHLDLVVKSNGETGFLSYLVSEKLQELVQLEGSGTLSVCLKSEDGGILIQMSDEDGKNAAFRFSTPLHSTIFNIYTQQMNKDQLVQVDFEYPIPGEWKINVYEQPFSCGLVLFNINDDTYKTDQRMKSINLDGLSIQTIKQQEKGSALVNLKVLVYANSSDTKPVSSCQGVIKVSH